MCCMWSGIARCAGDIVEVGGGCPGRWCGFEDLGKERISEARNKEIRKDGIDESPTGDLGETGLETYAMM